MSGQPTGRDCDCDYCMGTRREPNYMQRLQLKTEAERDEWKRRAEALYGQCTEIAKCPTYYDGCHCTAATVQHNIERADKAEAERDAALSLVRDLMDSHPCDHFDHHGYCQTHGWMQTDPPCPHGRAAKLMEGK